jgi:hypothetical protein
MGRRLNSNDDAGSRLDFRRTLESRVILAEIVEAKRRRLGAEGARMTRGVLLKIRRAGWNFPGVTHF